MTSSQKAHSMISQIQHEALLMIPEIYWDQSIKADIHNLHKQ